MKKTLLYASPFQPMRSGISDYSEILIYGLREFFDITLLIDNYKLENKQLYKDFKVKIYKKDKIDFKFFDFKIYNIGNQPDYHSYIYECALHYPGMIILHDFILYYLVVGYYINKSNFYSKIYEIGGPKALSLIKEPMKNSKNPLLYKEIAPLLPLNIELLKSDNFFMVHSKYTLKRIMEEVKDKKGVVKINHIELTKNIEIIEKKKLFDQYCIDKDTFLLCSFGYIDPSKSNDIVCEVVRKINNKSDKKITYLMVGEGDYIDKYLEKYIKKTGFVDIATFNSFIHHCNLVINLRENCMGETSGAVIRAMGLGKPCIISDLGWFSELPDYAVIKISNTNCKEELYKRIEILIKDHKIMETMSKKAKSYIKNNYSASKVCKAIYDFLNITK